MRSRPLTAVVEQRIAELEREIDAAVRLEWLAIAGMAAGSAVLTVIPLVTRQYAALSIIAAAGACIGWALTITCGATTARTTYRRRGIAPGGAAPMSTLGHCDRCGVRWVNRDIRVGGRDVGGAGRGPRRGRARE